MNYKNKEWLQNQYETKTTYEIAKNESVDPETIRKWMIRFEIKRREANTINYLEMSDDLKEFITGSMLGDGSVVWGSKDISAYFSIGSSHKEYLIYLKGLLHDLGIELRGSIVYAPIKKYHYWIMTSKYYRGAFPEFRMLWYPAGKKIVPDNLCLTKDSLRMFYIEDGNLSRVEGRGYIGLAVNNFKIDAVQIIKNMIGNLIGDDRIFVHNNKSGPTIHIMRKSTVKRFFDFIGPCPKELENIFGYKWL